MRGRTDRSSALAHLSDVGILLDGGVAWLQNDRQGLVRLTQYATGGTKIQEYGLVVGQDDDVVRCDVAVKALGFVQDLQGIEQGADYFDQPGFVGGDSCCCRIWRKEGPS
jgi:hypothetical protein